MCWTAATAIIARRPGDRFVSYLQNHDQVGNRARGDRITALLRSDAEKRLAAGLLLLAPQLPLLFMGEEYGEERPFQFFCSFLNPRLADAVRKGRRREFADLMDGDIPDPAGPGRRGRPRRPGADFIPTC
jgi:maltooligosyltrehalose trehalohydrolase